MEDYDLPNAATSELEDLLEELRAAHIYGEKAVDELRDFESGVAEVDVCISRKKEEIEKQLMILEDVISVIYDMV